MDDDELATRMRAMVQVRPAEPLIARGRAARHFVGRRWVWLPVVPIAISAAVYLFAVLSRAIELVR